MKVLVDENILNLTVAALRGAGHDVLDIRGTSRQGLSDEELWGLAEECHRSPRLRSNAAAAEYINGTIIALFAGRREF